MQLRYGASQPPRTQRGLSLVELMVGVVVSLFVVAAATLLMSTQMSDNRRLLLETQLQQDLRAAVDTITRDLRRSSYWNAAHTGIPPPVAPGSGMSVNANPMAGLSWDASNQTVNYRYRRAGGTEVFGFRLNGTVLESCQGVANSGGVCDGAWQQLTDPNAVAITAFSVSQARAATPNNGNALVLPCPNLCSDGTTACWPRVLVREFIVSVTGRTADGSIQRTLTSSLRVRNDRVDLSSEAATNLVCPIS